MSYSKPNIVMYLEVSIMIIFFLNSTLPVTTDQSAYCIFNPWVTGLIYYIEHIYSPLKSTLYERAHAYLITFAKMAEQSVNKMYADRRDSNPRPLYSLSTVK